MHEIWTTVYTSVYLYIGVLIIKLFGTRWLCQCLVYIRNVILDKFMFMLDYWVVMTYSHSCQCLTSESVVIVIMMVTVIVVVIIIIIVILILLCSSAVLCSSSPLLSTKGLQHCPMNPMSCHIGAVSKPMECWSPELHRNRGRWETTFMGQ